MKSEYTYDEERIGVPADRNFTDIEGPDGMVSIAEIIRCLRALEKIKGEPV